MMLNGQYDQCIPTWVCIKSFMAWSSMASWVHIALRNRSQQCLNFAFMDWWNHVVERFVSSTQNPMTITRFSSSWSHLTTSDQKLPGGLCQILSCRSTALALGEWFCAPGNEASSWHLALILMNSYIHIYIYNLNPHSRNSDKVFL